MRESSIAIYCQWINRFERYCHRLGLEPQQALTAAGVNAFADAYAQARSIDVKLARSAACKALRAWAQALTILGAELPRWGPPPCSPPSLPPPVDAFIAHLRQHRGNAESTLRKKAGYVMNFLAFLQLRRRRLAKLRLEDVDAYIVSVRHRYTPPAIGDVCGSVRDFLRFLHATGQLATDIASFVEAPRRRHDKRPLRSLPWSDVQRILQAVDRSTARGQRDYTLLLLMSAYGLGAGEALGLTIDDVDWRAATLHVVRPKTGTEILLPLLPTVAQTLADYLRHARPAHAPTRHVFVQMRVPHDPLSGASAIRHVLVKQARAAGVEATYLGSHVLRHSHARRQTELGIAPHVIGDILGHRRPESTSAYIRVATERLRQLALAVPQ